MSLAEGTAGPQGNSNSHYENTAHGHGGNGYAHPDEHAHGAEDKHSAALTAALYYHDHGCFVVPCCTMTEQGACTFPHTHDTEKSIGKRPILGNEWQNARLTREEIIAWWTKHPTANVGVLLEPSGLLVIDLDSEAATEEATIHGLPPGPQVRAGRGVHHYFRNPKNIIGLAIGRGESRKIDILSKGHVVGFGSVHRSGKRYALLTSWEEWPLENPPLWAEHLLLDSRTTQAEAEACPDDLPPIDLAALDLAPWLRAVIVQGQSPFSDRYPSRSEAVFAVACALVDEGCDTATIASILLDPRFAISEKPRQQGPRWTMGEIARARAKTATEDDATREEGTREDDATAGDAEDVAEDGPTEAPREDGAAATKRTIKITTHLSQMVDDTEAALMQLSGPILYQRARTICQIAPAGPSSTWLQRPPNTPIIIPTNVIGLREYGDRAATWMRKDKRAKAWVKVIPPAVLFETLAARVQWKFPVLEGIVSVPVLRPDGVVIQTPGYDRETGLFLDFNGTVFPPVPEHPTRDDAIAALDALYEPFADFPLQSPCHTSAAVASTLTLVARYAIRGNVPLFAVSAHTKGTGKGLLVNTSAMIGTGRAAPTWTQTLDEAEEAKRLLTLAMEGDACAHIDNVVHTLGNAQLDSALTSSTVKGRLLGRNASQEAPWTAILFASGNNMTFTSDMARRIVPIHLDAQCEHPELRSNFTHSLLLEWVQKQRPRLVVAALTTLKAFFCAGCPPQDIPEYGGFEQWSRLIRYALVWAGWHDPNDGRANIEAESDPSYEQLATLLTCWGGCYPDGAPRTLKVVMGDCERRRIKEPSQVDPANTWNDLWEALASYDSKYDGRKLDGLRIGNALRTIEGRILDGWRLVRKGTYRRAAQWKREELK